MISALGRCKAFRSTMSPTPIVVFDPTVISKALVRVERLVAILTPVRHAGVSEAKRLGTSCPGDSLYRSSTEATGAS